MPDEVLGLIIIAILAGTIITVVKYVVGYFSAKNQAVPNQSSLTTSELHELIQVAVAESTTPLLERIERLERQAGRDADAPLPSPTLLLDESPDEADEPVTPARQRRRVP